MNEYIWSVWKRCRLVGYVVAHSQWEATKSAEERFGKEIFIVRQPSNEKTNSCF